MTNLLSKDSRILVAGHSGLAGSAILRALQRSGYSVHGVSSKQVNLLDQTATRNFLRDFSPNVVVDAAARVGGIHANATYPAEFLSDNLRIQLNLMDASAELGVERFLFLGSSCIYPKFAEQPIKETSLLTGALEPTNDAYAIAKIAGIMQVQAVRRQYGLNWISAMPTNLYGPGDNFHPDNSHVLPALLRRFDEAKQSGADSVIIWGSGEPRREFLHVDDLATAIIKLLESYDSADTINVGCGEDISILELAKLIAEVTGFEGTIETDPDKPDGTPRKVLDISKLRQLGWLPSISLREGIEETYEWFLANQSMIRSK